MADFSEQSTDPSGCVPIEHQSYAEGVGGKLVEGRGREVQSSATSSALSYGKSARMSTRS